MSHSRQCFGEIYKAMREELQGSGGDDVAAAEGNRGGVEGGERGGEKMVVVAPPKM